MGLAIWQSMQGTNTNGAKMAGHAEVYTGALAAFMHLWSIPSPCYRPGVAHGTNVAWCILAPLATPYRRTYLPSDIDGAYFYGA